MTDRSEVYAAIDGERDYQVRRWADSATRGVEHSVHEFVRFIAHHAEIADATLCSESEPEASAEALNQVRKVAALAVACMERFGAPVRVAGVDAKPSEEPRPTRCKDGCDSWWLDLPGGNPLPCNCGAVPSCEVSPYLGTRMVRKKS